MTTDWLADLGLVEVAHNLWRHKRKGLEFLFRNLPRTGCAHVASCAFLCSPAQVFVMRDSAGHYYASWNATDSDIVDADRFADAIKLAARIARGYNAQKTLA